MKKKITPFQIEDADGVLSLLAPHGKNGLSRYTIEIATKKKFIKYLDLWLETLINEGKINFNENTSRWLIL